MIPILKRKSSASGFTLLEVLIALGLIAGVLVTVIELYSHNLNLQTEAQLISTVDRLANIRMSEIEASSDIQAGSSSGDFGEDQPMFRYTQEIETLPDVENLYKVKLTILSGDAENERNFVFETYIYRKQT